MPPTGDDATGHEPRALVAAAHAGTGTDAMRDGVFAAAVVLERAGISVQPGTLAVCAILAAGDSECELTVDVLPAVLRGATTSQ